MKLVIDDIQIGERRRQEMGDVNSLAESIGRYGLLHPVVVDADGRLVAGGRRILACEQLGWREIEARSLGDLTESERREIELEENLRRKDLTEYERSRNLVQLADTVTEMLTAEAELSGVIPDKPRRGRPRKPTAKDAVAERLGVDRGTVDNAQAHVETADAYPFMQTWKQYQVLEAHEALEQIPEPERPELATILSQPGIPAKQAIAIMRNIAAKESDERARIYELAQSDDKRDRSLALTEAAAMPAMPDPRLALLDDARAALRKAAKMFPRDPANEALIAVLECLKSAYVAVKDAHHA
jgi:hypothetical protein